MILTAFFHWYNYRHDHKGDPRTFLLIIRGINRTYVSKYALVIFL